MCAVQMFQMSLRVKGVYLWVVPVFVRMQLVSFFSQHHGISSNVFTRKCVCIVIAGRRRLLPAITGACQKSVPNVHLCCDRSSTLAR